MNNAPLLDTEDKAIIIGLRKDDHKCFNDLFAKYYPGYFGFILGMVKDTCVAEDIAQNVFSKVWIHRQSLNPELSMRSYLYTLAKYEIYNHFRFKYSHVTETISTTMTDTTADTYDLEAHYCVQEMETQIMEAVDHLPGKRREVFRRSRLNFQSAKEIAQSLGMSVRTVEKHIQLALRDIRCCLATLTLLLGVVTATGSDFKDYTIATTDTEGEYFGVAMANGCIGLLSDREPLTVSQVMLNHVMDENREDGVSRGLRGINPFCMKLVIDGDTVSLGKVDNWSQSLDMRHAMITDHYNYNGTDISSDTYALRGQPFAGITTVKVTPKRDIELSVVNPYRVPEEYSDTASHTLSVKLMSTRLPIHRVSGVSKLRNRVVSASSAIVFPEGAPVPKIAKDNSFSVKIPAGTTLEFSLIGAVCSDRDFLDPRNESDRQVATVAVRGVPVMRDDHLRRWEDLWQGDIEIVGDDEAQQVARMSLYTLYSNCREDSRLSITPFGLSWTEYNGHVFWDTELWMYPPMLLLNQGIARSMMDYRSDRREAAHRRALANGYRGAMFPWESDDEGEEGCPVRALMGGFEHHINGDIAVAARDYFRVTRDTTWLARDGWPLLRDIADFWTSRVTPNPDGSYSIVNVVCPDEYAKEVTDNAFTNAVAAESLRAAHQAAQVLGVTPDSRWLVIADGLRIPTVDGVTAEFEGFTPRQIKQADVNLMAYPLNVVTNPEQIRRDLEYYHPLINPNGPAMSYAILAILYSRLGDVDKANELFVEAYRPHMRPPYGVISENASDNRVNFATGAGGFLQTIINGFGGVQVQDISSAMPIDLVPSKMPRHWESLTIRGLGPDRLTLKKSQKGATLR
ncbi:MAG: RNA polymerase sigma-70 factor [Bacteroidales bacterium]|nr:RNA polymerase sigma-70 factor [Bacteroidales bacterium]